MGSKTEAAAKRPVFTDEIDQRIREGYHSDYEAVLRELSDIGFNDAAVERRVVSLGLLRAPAALGSMRVAKRRCLGCDQSFVSDGWQNRMCKRCLSRG
jgi:hypothetical protein